MSTEKFFIADPYNDEHIALLEQFEQENNIYTKSVSYLKDVRQKNSKETYQKKFKERNEINQILLLKEDAKLKDSCHLQGEKDIKTCNITFSPIKTKSKNRHLLTLVTDYAFNILGMEEVFVSITPNDSNLEANLILKGFENLGLMNGSKTYLKERELEKQSNLVQNI